MPPTLDSGRGGEGVDGPGLVVARALPAKRRGGVIGELLEVPLRHATLHRQLRVPQLILASSGQGVTFDPQLVVGPSRQPPIKYTDD